MKLSVLAEIAILKFPQETYRKHELSLVVDRSRDSWKVIAGDGLCIRSQRWYKPPDTAFARAKAHIHRELVISKIRDVVGWV